MNNIQVDLVGLPEKVKAFVEHELALCERDNVKVDLLQDDVNHNGNECSGYFEDVPVPCLTVSMNKSWQDWLPIFVHETCHKDQFVEGTAVWNNKIAGKYDALDILDLWTDRVVELTPRQLKPVISQIVAIELDCEQRSLEKIKKFDLPINHIEYIQKSNAYVFYYHAIAYKRKYSTKTAPYSNPDVWSKMPVDWNNNYAKIKNKMLDHFIKHCY